MTAFAHGREGAAKSLAAFPLMPALLENAALSVDGVLDVVVTTVSERMMRSGLTVESGGRPSPCTSIQMA